MRKIASLSALFSFSRCGLQLLPLQLVEHAIDALIRRVAAGLCSLSCLQRLVRSALRALSCLPGFVRCSLSGIRGILSCRGCGPDFFELFRGHGCTAGCNGGADDQGARAQDAR
jgi:hypothetical protein